MYKIVTTAQWNEAARDGLFRGAPVDLTDGFIHFSAPDQVEETARKHFAGQRDLLIIALDAATLGPALRWEPSRGGQLFPHLYGTFPPAQVEWVRPLPLRPDGDHDFTGLLA